MPWQFFLGINLITATVREIMNKRVANTMDPVVGLFYVNLVQGLLFYIWFFLLYRRLPVVDVGVASAGVLFAVAYACYYSALRFSLSQSILFQSYSLLITIILSAVFLGEMKYFDISAGAGLRTIMGIFLALISLWFLLHQKNMNKEQRQLKWLIFIAGTILFLGIGSFISAAALRRMTSLEVLINQTDVMVPAVLLLAFLSNRKFKLKKEDVSIVVTNAFFAVIAVVTFMNALVETSVSKLYPIQQVLLVISVMTAGVVLYKETQIFSKQRLIGIILGLTGVILLAFN